MTVPFQNIDLLAFLSDRPRARRAMREGGHPDGSRHLDRNRFGLVADYGKGLVLSYRLEAAHEARIEVLRPDGSRVARFEAGSRARRLAIPLELAQGLYLVMVEGGISRFVASVSVPA